MNKWQWLASILISMHLLVVLVIPNPYSYFQYTFKDWMWPYANTLNIAYMWQFFSPDPSAAIYYDYSLIKDYELVETIRFPEKDGPFLLRSNYTRRLSLKNIFMKFPNLNNSLFVPFYCEKFPDIENIEITKVLIRPVSFEEAIAGRSLLDKSEYLEEFMGMQSCHL